jgi:hypothetical protein
MISRLLAKPATTVQDAVEKQVFADRPDRGTTAAVGGLRALLRAGARRWVGFGRPAPSARVSDAARIVRAGLAGAVILPRWINIDRSPPPLAAALALPRTPGRSAEVFVDGDLEAQVRRSASAGKIREIVIMGGAGFELGR